MRAVGDRPGHASKRSNVRGKEGGEGADKSLCSRNARPQKGLVRRAQVRLYQPPP